MPRNSLPIDALLKALADAPIYMLACTKDFTDEELHVAPGPAECLPMR